MPAVSHRYQTVYFPIPKNATSSLKPFFYALDSGHPFTPRLRKKLGISVHGLYPSIAREPWQRYYQGYTSIVVVRDPIKRLLSAYSERVIEGRAMAKRPWVVADLEKLGRSASPSLEEFIEHLAEYRSVSEPVRSHTIPQSQYVKGFWPKIAHRIPIERLAEIPQIIENATGEKVELPHVRSSGKKLKASDLSATNFDKLVAFYRADYNMLKELYSPDALR